jgi:membrane fusion protein (multidrug efflux system)
VRAQQATAAQGDALVITRRAELESAHATLARREPLAAEHAVSNEELADARTAVGRATAALKQAEAQARGAHAAVDGVAVADNPAVLQARAVFREAWIAAHRNTIVAPVSGRVAQRMVQVGQHVQPGQSLLVVIPEDEMWVDANFRETQLKHLRVGQRASVVADVYGSDVQFHGRVAGVSAGTGAAFALLPPQNASGNWIKVIQRVPVRIALDRAELAQHPLRIGLSTEVRVDLVAAPEPAAAESGVSGTRVYELDLAQGCGATPSSPPPARRAPKHDRRGAIRLAAASCRCCRAQLLLLSIAIAASTFGDPTRRSSTSRFRRLPAAWA